MSTQPSEALYGHDMDYGRLPLHFERYSLADQTRIANRLSALQDAAKQGIDLEDGPFPAAALSVEEALRLVDVLKG